MEKPRFFDKLRKKPVQILSLTDLVSHHGAVVKFKFDDNAPWTYGRLSNQNELERFGNYQYGVAVYYEVEEDGNGYRGSFTQENFTNPKFVLLTTSSKEIKGKKFTSQISSSS